MTTLTLDKTLNDWPRQKHQVYFSSIPVHIKLEKFKNEALFLLLGPPSTLIRHQNRAFGFFSFKPEKF